MADRLDELSTIDYKANVEYDLNETPGKLTQLSGSMDTYTGPKAQISDRFDDLYLEDKTTRNGDTNNTELGSERRWVNKPPSANVAPMKDRDDQLETKVDLDSPLVKQTAVATRRYHDDMWLAGYYGNAYTGEHGDVAVPFDSNNVVVHGGVGLTYAKLVAAIELMELSDVDIEAEAPVLLITPKQKSDLFNMAEYKSADYMQGYPIARGEVKSILGIRFIVANLGSTKAYKRSSSLTKTSTTRSLPFFVPSGVHRAVWTEFWGKITERDDKQFSKQYYAEACSTMTRLNEAKCYKVECTET